MPQSKTSPRRAKKLDKRRQDAQRRVRPMSYSEMLDRLRETLNARFYEEQGFPHLEYLAANYKGPEQTGNLSDHLQMNEFFIGMTAALAHALRADAKMTMEEREDACTAVAYAIAATLICVRRDFRDESGWMGPAALAALRHRWGEPKMRSAGLENSAAEMDDRSLACYFGMDFVMTILDMTGELAERGGDTVISVTTCKDEVITAFTSYLTANPALAGSRLVDLERIFAANAVTEEFRADYPAWRPESADALNPAYLGMHAVSSVDTAYVLTLLADGRFLHDMRALYVRYRPEDIPQGRREETLMAYALRYGPRCQKAFAENRDPTEEEMDRDAETINLLIMTYFLAADPAFVPGIDDDPPAEESEGVVSVAGEEEARTWRATLPSQAIESFEAWRSARDALKGEKDAPADAQAAASAVTAQAHA